MEVVWRPLQEKRNEKAREETQIKLDGATAIPVM
jgi:hypothetical protein